MTEFGFIDSIKTLFAPLPDNGFEGIGDDFIPSIVDRRLIDTVLPVNDDDAVLMAARLAKELGLGVGISSGANLLGAIELTRRGFGPAATVFADDSKKYLTTALAAPAPPREGFLSPRVELLGWSRADAPRPVSLAV